MCIRDRMGYVTNAEPGHGLMKVKGYICLLYTSKEGDEFWTKAETLLYCALVAYIVFERCV